MRTLIILIVLLINSSLFSQETLVLEPEIGKTYDFSQERQELWDTCDSLEYRLFPIEKFTQEERNRLMNKCDKIGYNAACDDMWSVICGNHWTDEGYNMVYYRNDPNYKFSTVSSAFKSQCEIKYDSSSISDLNYKTAWVEGVRDYGIGETVAFKFPPGHPRITKVIIANGYIKDKITWKNNARVKQLKMYLNNKPFAILNLKDVYAEQTFELPTIGYKDRDLMKYDYSNEKIRVLDKRDNELLPDTIKFEILSVYKGNKYKDTAITEIYFNGLDVY